ncbi:methyl-accepting chemotaxis protein [Virgibacillus oceani]
MGFIKNAKISRKLLTLIIVSILMVGTVGFTGYKYMTDMAEGSEVIYNEYLTYIDKLGNMQKNNFAIDSYTMEAMITTDTAEHNQLIENIDSLVEENLSLESEELFPEEVIDMDTYYELIDVYISGRTQALEMAQTDNQAAYEYYLDNVYDYRFELDNIVTEIQTYFANEANAINQDNEQRLTVASLILLGVTIAGLILYIVLGILITRAIVNPIKQLQNLMAKAEAGELKSGDYQSKDEIGQLASSFNGMIDGITQMIWKAKETSEIVVSSSEQLSASAKQGTQASEHITSTIQEMASGASSQLQSVEETAETMDKMVQYTEQIADNAEVISNSTNDTSNMSAQGKQSIDKVTAQMNVISENVDGLGSTIKNLSEHLNQIGTINEAITTIAEQTNLLSLNAAIEAARAGEHGKGFSVVAEEVRKLAEESANSAEKINDLIGMIQNETNKTMESMESSQQEVKAGTLVVNEAGEAFDDIEVSINNVVEQFNNINTIINELATDAEQAKQSMDSVKNVAEESTASTQNVSAATEEQLASMEEIQASSEDLAKVSEELQDAVENFTI